MQELASRLSGVCNCPIADQTALAGRYSFTLTCSVDQLIAITKLGESQSLSTLNAESIFEALQSQLGLKLERKKVPAEVVVVDHIEKLSVEN